ncbi:Golgi integral membrane protein 4a isoform X1 [Poecilia latipinna]|uniref:Golgi integral membrane protein 4 n=1 Tax=Poecilia latipinna TaxID=48699 RepID=A0A3B3VK10_9TELE|nr:PREDICTED: Golgi integral membrane protein 4 isoform X1 [Poecilia latipinna]
MPKQLLTRKAVPFCEWKCSGSDWEGCKKLSRKFPPAETGLSRADGGEGCGSNMGNGVCSRRQRRIFQCLLLVTVVCGMMYGGLMSYEMHKQLRRTEATALKYQQHQESLSAQLQVVYEHRSRLEKSLQKERLEHKKAKEDYLVYKLEAEQSLNKEKQDANSRLNSLQVQHQMLKNQHDELKRQYYELNEQHQAQGEDHGRLLDEHRDRYNKLQQAKEVEVSQLKEHVYNLREENKQLRKAHHEIHTQLQDAQLKHQNLKAVHDQLALTLEDHKSALAVAQAQVDEYKQLKETLNREPNRAQPDPNSIAQQLHAATVTAESHVHQSQQAAKETRAQGEQRPHWDTESMLDNQEEKEANAQSEVNSHPAMSQPGLSERDEDREGEAERKRELAEEEMAQAGQPQKLEEDLDQAHDEQMEEEEEREEEQPDENALDRQRRQPQLDNHAELHQGGQLQQQQQAPAQVYHLKSAYEQQQEQRRLETLRDNERRQIQMRQEALQAQREKVLKEREQRLKEEKEREEQQNREADRKEQLLREEHQRKRLEYENMNEDVPREEDRRTANEGERDVHMLHEEEQEEKRPAHMAPPHQGGVDGEVDPEDDPNNQGEDEFEEAEDEHPAHRAAEEEEEGEEEEPAAPGQHIDSHPGPGRPAMEEELVMAGNPDQQEDALDDQYQEEDEAQEDVAGGEKRQEEGVEEEGEDPYNENTEQNDAKNQDGPRKKQNHQNGAHEEENYEEEEEEVEEDAAGQDKGTNRRAEM